MADLQLRVKELEKRVDELTKEREDLYRDIENLCMQNDNSFWSGSAVLSARIGIAEENLNRLTAENNGLKAQRDSLREDLAQFRDAKRDADRISKEEMEKNRVLERELAFYKKQCERALEDRNLFSYDVEELKRANLELERTLHDVEGRVESEALQRAEVDRKLQESEGRVSTLEERLIECARIPELESQLRESRRETEQLRETVTCLEGAVEGAREELETYRVDLDEAHEAHAALAHELEVTREEARAEIDAETAIVETLQRKLAQMSEKLTTTGSELHEADSAVAAAQAQVELIRSEREHEVSRLREEYQVTIQELEGRVNTAEDLLHNQAQELQEVTQAKVEALISMSEWQAKATRYEQRLGELEAKIARVDHRGNDLVKEQPLDLKRSTSQEEGGPRSWFTWSQGKQSSGQNVSRNVETHV